jgi:hypothetical protein
MRFQKGENGMSDTDLVVRYFVSYSGIKLPLKLVNELSESGIDNRNTYFRAAYDSEGKLIHCQKLVYGEKEMEHQYSYYDTGAIRHATIMMAGETRELEFAKDGSPL